MANSILDIVEQSLLNIANRYKEFSSNPDVAESDLKGFDEQLNDIMDRYNKLKGLQSTYTAEELTIKLNEFQVLYDDLVLKINNGFFKGADGQSLTFEMLTSEQKESLKGDNGLSAYELASQNGFQGTEAEYLESLKGQDGNDLTFEMLTSEQKELLKGQNGLSAYELASQNGFQGTEAEYLESLKGLDGKDLTFEMLTSEQKESLKGQNGLSAYELASQNGFQGTEAEFLQSLKGADGQSLTYDSLTLAEKEDLASHVTVSGSGGGTSPMGISDIQGLNQVISDLYTKHGEQEQKFAGINLSQFYQQTQGHLGELDGKVIPLFNAFFGVYEEDEATGQQILVQEGLLDKFNSLYAQVNPNTAN